MRDCLPSSRTKTRKSQTADYDLSWRSDEPCLIAARAVEQGVALAVSEASRERRAPVPDETYPRWVRTALTRRAADPTAAMLFDSTIPEPTDLLAGVVRRA